MNLLLIVRSRTEDIESRSLEGVPPLNVVGGVVWSGENLSVWKLVSGDRTTASVIVGVDLDGVIRRV